MMKMVKNDLDEVFTDNIDYYKDYIKKQSKRSNMGIIRNNRESTDDILSVIYLDIIEKLDRFESKKHMHNSIKVYIYRLLNFTRSKYTLEMYMDNSTLNKISNLIDIQPSPDDGEWIPLIDIIHFNQLQEEEIDNEHLQYIGGKIKNYKSNCTKPEKILYDMYFNRGFDKISTISIQLNIPYYSCMVMVKYMLWTLEFMIKKDQDYNTCEKLSRERIKNKFGGIKTIMVI